jgi:hypothetical protein
MSTGLHSDLALAERHPAPSLEYANAAARTGAVGLTSDDIGRVARQTDDGSLWWLKDDSPLTWVSAEGAGAGETNTASNVGTAGVGVFKQKTGVDLEFKKVNAGSSKISVTDDTGDDEVDIDVVEANISHANIGGVTADQHHARQHALGAGADHTSATLSEFNALVSDATLDDSSDTRDPNVHGSSAHTGTIGAHSQLSGVGADDHHVHANKTQLDLITDGDHDVRTDNPHSVTAAQAGAAVVTSTAPVDVTKEAAAVGTSSEAARQDHKHDITTAAAGAAIPGNLAAEGSATSLARSDHTHSLPAYGTGSGTFCEGDDSRLSDARTPTAHAASHQSGGGDAVKLDDLASPDDNTDLDATTSAHGLLPKLGGGTDNFLRADGTWVAPPGGVSLTSTAPVNVTKSANAVGVGTTAARHDHKHDVSTATTSGTAVRVGNSAAEGSATTLARSDHTHAVSDGTPVNVTKSANAPGSAVTFARSDHKHDVSTAAPSATGVDTASGEGSATTVARSDHTHQSNTSPSNVTKAAASIGTSGQPARADHKHDITTATAAAQVPGDSAIEGSATSLARSDHKHSLPAYGTGSGTFCQGNDSRLSDARTPTAHKASHQSGGSDAIKLDDLASPDDNTDLNSTTSAHGLLPKLGGGTTNFLRADGSWAEPSGGGSSVFGSLYQYASSDGESSTTSNSSVQKLRLTTASLTAGHKYRIGFYFEWRLDNTNNDYSAQVEINDTTKIMVLRAEPADTTSYHCIGGFYEHTAGSSGSINIDLDYWAWSTGTAYIRRARLEIWRVA